MANQTKINAQTGDALTVAQLSRVREILGFSPGSADSTTMATAVAALAEDDRKNLKAIIYSDWDRIPQLPVTKTGKTEYSTTYHRYLIVNNVRILLGFPALTFAVYMLTFTPTGPAFGLVRVQVADAEAVDEYCAWGDG